MLISKRKDLRQYLSDVLEVAVLLAFLIVGAILFVRIITYILPFVIGFVIAVTLLPLARLLERAGLPRQVAIVVTLVLVLGTLLAVLSLLIVQGAEEAASLSQAIPHYFSSWRAWIEGTVNQGFAMYAHLPKKMLDAMQSTTTSAVTQLRGLALSAVSSLFGGVAQLPDLIAVTVISVISAYFFMVDRALMMSGLRRLLPPGWTPKLESVAGDVVSAIAGLLRAQLVLIAVTSVINIIGLSLMRLHYAIIMGLAIGFTGWVPIVGSGIITIPWAVGALIFGNYVIAIKIVILQAVASLVRHTIEPKLLASNMGLGTFPTLVGMYVGLTSIGFVGLLIGPIVLIAIRSLIRARMFVDFFPDRSSVLPAKADDNSHKPQ